MRRFPAIIVPLVLVAVAAVRAQTLSIAPSATTYSAAGGTITFSVNLTYTQAMASIGLAVRAPAGWSYQSSAGSGRPQIGPAEGTTGNLEFAYTSVPPSPIEFTFDIAYPAGLSGNHAVSQIGAILRPSVGNRQDVPHADVVLTSAAGGPGPDPIPVTAPSIVTPPASVTIAPGQTATFSVVASGTMPLSYQWRKDGVNVAGATAASLSLANVAVSAAGAYSVVVTNSAGSAISAAATLVVGATPAPPQIITHPAAAAVSTGSSVTFSVAATGAPPLLYSWIKDGVTISGATGASLTLDNLQAASAGAYSVVVTNSAGSATSNSALLSIAVPGFVPGAAFGAFGGNGGSFAMLLRPDRTGVFLGYARAAQLALIARGIVVDAAGRFRASSVPLGAVPENAVAGTARAANEYIIEGTLAANGTITGTISGLELTFSAPAPVPGATAALAGYYQAGVAGNSAASHTIVGAAGDIYVVTSQGSSVDAGRGVVSVNGALEITTEKSARVVGAVAAQEGTITMDMAAGGGAALTFIGANPDTRANVEKLVNISTRSQTGTAEASLIAGFVISGRQPKPVLVRAVGPTLSSFGVAGALPAARLEIFRGATLIAAGNDWAAGGNAAAIASTAGRLGAFELPGGSRDAAVLVTLEPDAYTAVVSGQGGAAGVGLVEVYDATEGAIAHDQRIINISTRALAGAGDDVLIAGFVINGSIPKRVLVRGAGPALSGFGVDGFLARPQLVVYAGSTELTRNADWSTSPDAAAIAEASARVGAFAFTAGSADAALIVNLSPGGYTAQVSGAGGTTGIALLEVYELP